jgi:hypothetical protein
MSMTTKQIRDQLADESAEFHRRVDAVQRELAELAAEKPRRKLWRWI